VLSQGSCNTSLSLFFHRYFALNSCTLCISKNGYISRSVVWKIWQASQRIFVLHSKYCAQLMFLEVCQYGTSLSTDVFMFSRGNHFFLTFTSSMYFCHSFICNKGHGLDHANVYVKLKDRKRSLSRKNDHNALWH